MVTTTKASPHNHAHRTADCADDRKQRAQGAGPADDVASYTVKKGDTLTSIAKAHGSSVQELRDLNPELRGDMIRPGQKLEVLKVDAPTRKPVDADTQRSSRARVASSDEAMRNKLEPNFGTEAPSFADVKGGEIMKRGMGGENVKELQKKLNRLGADLEVDGKFGPKTQAAVRDFQGDHKLKQDGHVDAKTVDALEKAKPRSPSDRARANNDGAVNGPVDPSLGPTKTATAYTNGVPRTIRVVEVEGKLVEVKQAQRYLEMKKAAAKDGVDLDLVSGFRTMAEQRRLYDGWVNRRPGFNLAAKPGYSEHQNGTALDLNTQGTSDANGSGKVYNWLKNNAGKFGFERIPAEHWHWEFKG